MAVLQAGAAGGGGRLIVVGAGVAGMRTVVEMRRLGYAGGITLIGTERHRTYDRPLLSKAVLGGEADSATIAVDWDGLAADLRLGETAEVLYGTADGAGVETAGGRRYDGDAVVIATGAVANRLPGAPHHVLRTLDDTLGMRARFRPGLRVVIVGASWTGAEAATAAVRAGCEVTVVHRGAEPLAGIAGAEVGAYCRGWYEQAGVALRLGRVAERVEPAGLLLAGGEVLPADAVLVATGASPAVGWLRDSPVALGDGVLVDEGLRTGLATVYAVGDCAAFVSRRYGTRIRVDHWDTAMNGPAVAAANLLGGDEVYDPVPYFWSEQFGRSLHWVGRREAWHRAVWRGGPQDEAWGVCWFSGEYLAAFLGVNWGRDALQARRLIQAGASLDQDRAADPAVPLKKAAR
ncbi:NAD(P)/FAD-dependent oxidoreductase [Actinacidiphila bryophytorum]|uniref:Ferredoxin reductase n=1 Tax=Actinacidiphila bryophytorum TaxID=1436133 RepID=A0A9W4MAM9_9ACTN|nr:FAD-dependent oxidoreductase [Actinacidiphila bryophytorum]MBM9440629.1 oxidoreductase [Actinacidiphila bryophytorum]MBN6544153.1 oxidoreductase [Actinacidiphila bryophytorum]CAG7644171.1 Ferredoxin reductase [Actinacidiphila bryophytorum]